MSSILATRRATSAINSAQRSAFKFTHRTLPLASSRWFHSAQPQSQAAAAAAVKLEDHTDDSYFVSESEPQKLNQHDVGKPAYRPSAVTTEDRRKILHSSWRLDLPQKVGNHAGQTSSSDQEAATLTPTSTASAAEQKSTFDQVQLSVPSKFEARDTREPSMDSHEVLADHGVATRETSENEVSQSVETLQAAVSVSEEPLYWQKIPRWCDVPKEVFLTHKFQTRNTVNGEKALKAFLAEVLPEKMPFSAQFEHIRTSEDFIQDVVKGIKAAPMAIRLTPHILCVTDWNNPFEDPLRRQFIPLGSSLVPDHPKLELDSLHETEDSPVKGLVHRYPDKVLFLALDVCPHYCRYCTRSYAIGSNTEMVSKDSIKPGRKRWDPMIEYISQNSVINDVVVSGGDCYILTPDQIRWIGEQLLAIPHVKRFRFATKGIAVNPMRILDKNDTWTDEVIRLSWKGRRMGKSIAIHTHFNHPAEFTWTSRKAAQRLFENGVVVRNQSVLLKGVNDDVATMSKLIRELADNNIQPYYVYQQDMVKGVDDLRTNLQTILDLELQIRGSIAGFMMPNFVVDLPGGGGKRLASSYQTYDRRSGVSTFMAPAVAGAGKENKVYEYYDPEATLQEPGSTTTPVSRDIL